MDVDYTPLIEPAITILAVILTALAGWLSLQIRTHLQIKNDSLSNKALHDALDRGVAAAIAAATRAAQSRGGKLHIGNKLVAEVVQRTINFSDDTVKRLGVDNKTLEYLVKEKIDSLITLGISGEATSPATITTPKEVAVVTANSEREGTISNAV
jgi:hypothetical protein